MTVNPQAFALQMAERWQNSLHGVVTPALQQVWIQQAEIYNAKIKGEYPGQWLVLQPPTGSGKSRGLETYCAMLLRDNHPGVLIVVRMIEDADGMANTINDLGDNTAIACHSENQVAHDNLSSYPVLIITHSAYKIGVSNSGLWSKFSSWDGGNRKLVVIDETLNIIDQTQINLDQLRELRGVIPDFVQDQCQEECNGLDQVISVMAAITLKAKSKGTRVLSKDWELSGHLDMSKLKKAMRLVKFDEIILNKIDEEERGNLVRKYCKMLDALELIVQLPCWYAKKGNWHLFTRSRVVVPRDKLDAVVMDATASCNPLYELLGKNVILIDPPEHVRSYKNVTLHVSIGHKTGKLSMSKNPQEDARNFIASMATKLPKDREVFICTHKAVKAHLIGYEQQMPRYEVAHWGAIDGKNLWNECDTAILYGLPYLDAIVPEAMLQAIDEWRGRKLTGKDRKQMVHRLEIGHQIVSLVQAMNRVRCRNVIDINGDCAQTDIFLLLPNKERAKEIICAVDLQMPRMKYELWQSAVLKRRVKRSGYEPALITYLIGMSRGSSKAQDVRKELDIPATSFNRLIKKAVDPDSKLYRELAEVGVIFRQHGKGQGGRGCYSSFEKST